jgi:adenosine deaminase
VRTANAFLAAEVHIIGHKRWNRRGAMVTDRYQHVRHHNTVEEFIEWANTAADDGGRLPIMAIDNVPGCSQIENLRDAQKLCFAFWPGGPGF